MTDLSFPAFLYDKYAANPDDLEEGLFKGRILLQVCRTQVAYGDFTGLCRVTKPCSRRLPQPRTSRVMVMGRMSSETTDSLRNPPLASKSKST